MSVKALTIGMVRENIAAMQEILVMYGLTIHKAELRGLFFRLATRKLFLSSQHAHSRNVIGIVDVDTWGIPSTSISTRSSSQQAHVDASAKAREVLFPPEIFGGSP